MSTKESSYARVLLRGGGVVTVVLLWAVLAKAQTTTHTLLHDGQTRTYRLFLPSDYAPGAAIPLVLNLHGRGSNGVQQQLYTRMDAVADTAGFAVCYPDGIGNEWNVGWSFGTRTDDVGFLTRLMDTLQEGYGFDERRTYSIGMSNGGFMSYVLACERPRRLAAIASVTGGMVPGRRERCRPGVPVPVMQIHGTGDAVVGYDGTAGVNEAIEATVAGWASINGCQREPTVSSVPDVRADGFTTERLVYGDCDAGAEVQLLRVAGGGHTWPSGAIDLGGTTYDFSASAEVWGFLRRFTRGETSTLDEIAEGSGDLLVWPNPVRWGRLSLKPADRLRDLELVDARGRTVSVVRVAAGVGEVDLGGVSAGVYWLRDSGAVTQVLVE